MTDLYDGLSLTLGFKGSQSFYMQYDAGALPQYDFELTISNANQFYVYVNAGLANDPSEFYSDIADRGQVVKGHPVEVLPVVKNPDGHL